MHKEHTSRCLVAVALFAAVLALCGLTALPATAIADELSDTKAELEEQVGKLDELVAQLDAAQSEIDTLQAQIEEKAQSATELEGAIAENREDIGELVVFFYKNPTVSLIEYLLESDSLSQMIARTEFLYGYTEDLADMTAQEDAQAEALNAEVAEISAQKDEQVAVLEQMQADKEELQQAIDELEDKKDELEAEQRAKLDAASGKLSTFNTDFDNGEWHTGKASAYGGSSDGPAVSTTATGAKCTDTSTGVAIPMAWSNYRSYFGRKVEISYNGQSVIATVNDCGSMGGGSRSLDLQPGVFKAFGYNTCNAWGVRTVKYRFL